MTAVAVRGWNGCYGVRVDGGPLEIGRSTGTPLLDASITLGAVEPTAVAGDVLWCFEGDVATPDGPVSVVQRLRGQPGGPYVVTSSSGSAVFVDPRTGHVVVDAANVALRLQWVTTFGLPLLLHRVEVLLLHASAVSRDGKAIAICGASGRGKSSALVGLIDRGWRAITEDVCVVDVRGNGPLVWPGPPWVRRLHGDAGPDGATVRFETPDKKAWDIAPWQATAPVPLAEIVMLDEPAADPSAAVRVGVGEAIGHLASASQWFTGSDQRGQGQFPAVIDIATRVAMRRVRLQWRDSWLDELVELLAARL